MLQQGSRQWADQCRSLLTILHDSSRRWLRNGADPSHDPKLAGETVRQLVQKDLGSVPVGSPMAYRMQDLLTVIDNAGR